MLLQATLWLWNWHILICVTEALAILHKHLIQYDGSLDFKQDSAAFVIQVISNEIWSYFEKCYVLGAFFIQIMVLWLKRIKDGIKNW